MAVNRWLASSLLSQGDWPEGWRNNPTVPANPIPALNMIDKMKLAGISGFVPVLTIPAPTRQTLRFLTYIEGRINDRFANYQCTDFLCTSYYLDLL